MEKDIKIAAIIVTYNRSELLEKCLAALEQQTFKPITIFIIDNASTDNTNYIVNSMVHQIPYEYVKLGENIGGAGGFHTGLRIAHEKNIYNAFWIMDDDGLPQKDCLKNLSEHINEFPYVAPLVVNIDNEKELAFEYKGSWDKSIVIDRYSKNGLIYDMSSPFNGILLRKDLIDNIGYPKKEMFIWGDEVEYNQRAKKNGYSPVTVTSAIHRHPKDRLEKKDSLFVKEFIIDVGSPLRNYCKYRNTAYVLKKYKGKIKLTLYYLIYIFYFIFQDKCNIKKCKFFHNAFMDGVKSRFENHRNYL